MNFKNWPYWVKGGIKGIIILLLLCTLGLLFGSNDLGFLALAFIPLYPVYFLLQSIPTGLNPEMVVFVWTPLLTLVLYFALGAIIGYLYGKIKNRNNLLIKEKSK